MTKLDPTVKAMWCKALRSGKYKQGKEMLYRAFNNTYCCLGVARALKLPNARKSRCNAESLTSKFLPDDVMSELIIMNDGGVNNISKTFPEIADWIEKNL